MKQELFVLSTKTSRDNLISRILDFDLSGKVKVTISDAGSKSTRQRGLQFKWYTEVAAAGVGGRLESTKEGVHLYSKWRWAIPILIRDDEFFGEIFSAWKQKWGSDPERMEWFVSSQVHTESMTTSQVAELLTEFERHYRPMVNLTNPDDLGLNLG